MPTLFSKVDQIREHFLNRTYGWTGIEVGCHGVIMAQVRTINDRWQLAAVWRVDHPVPYARTNESHTDSQTESNASSTDETFGWLASGDILDRGLSSTFSQLEQLDQLFVGKSCAATLNDGLIAYRELELPTCDETESHSMVQSEVAIESECDLDEVLTDCWTLPQSRPRSTTSSFAAVSLKRSSAMILANDFRQAGFECRVLDALPCAMARATQMASANTNDDGQALTLAVDLGYQHATITLVDNGTPILTRVLRNSGLVQLLEQIASAFEVSLADAQTLLFQSPSNRSARPDRNDDFSNPLQQRRNGYLLSLTHEIEKTILFANRTYRSTAPIQILLMGNGVCIPNVEQSIEQRLDLPTRIWTIDVANNLFGMKHVGVYAIACGLSALAWEGI
jgi:Tfp pilus assembly PilM family ATPase